MASSRRIVEPNGASTSRNRGDAAPTERLEQPCGCLHIGPVRATAGIDAAKTQRIASAAEVADRRLQRRSRLVAGHVRVLPDDSGLRRCRLFPRALEADSSQYWEAQTPPREPIQMKPAQQSAPLVLQASPCLTQTDPRPRRDGRAESICPWGPLRSLGGGITETF